MLLLPTRSWGRAHFCRALHVAMQIGPSHPVIVSRVWRMVSEDSGADFAPAFPADCPHLSDFHCRRLHGEYRRIHRVFQHIARFVNGTTAVQAIVTAAVYRGFGSKLRSGCPELTSLLNLPAPGRRQTLYVVLRLSRVLCF